MRKIIQANIKTLDEKGHVNFYILKDIVPDSIVFKHDKKPPQPTPPLEEEKSSKKEQKKSSKK